LTLKHQLVAETYQYQYQIAGTRTKQEQEQDGGQKQKDGNRYMSNLTLNNDASTY
jgi:hypothetical protein